MSFSLSPIASLGSAIPSINGTKENLGTPEKICEEFGKTFFSKMLSTITDSMQSEDKQDASGMQKSWAWNLMADAVGKEIASSGQLGLGKQLTEALKIASSEKP